jgi:hypothetical protein
MALSNGFELPANYQLLLVNGGLYLRIAANWVLLRTNEDYPPLFSYKMYRLSKVKLDDLRGI